MRPAVRYAPALRDLLLGGLDIVQQFQALEERVVLADIKEHGDAAPVLGEHDRSARALHAAHAVSRAACNALRQENLSK